MKYALALLITVFVIHQSLAQEYVPGLIVVKFKDESTSSKKQMVNVYDVNAIGKERFIKSVKPFAENVSLRKNSDPSRLDNLYKIEITDDMSEEGYVEYLNGFDNVEYAEQYPNVKPLYVPNDPEAQFGQAQFHLEQINVYDAWSISQGNSDVVIGIIDTGADLDHEDLRSNLYLNEADPIDGVDNDGDGYTDNYYGWDFADNDNMPESDGSAHGSGVTGIAAAATDNGTGIAGIGFNTKFMPIKIFQTQNNFSRNSYEAIIYAADKGCDIINLSWGNSGRYSQFAQDIINYAVLEQDVVVIAAAGNTNAELDFFPASYDNVISVGYVNADDSKSSTATYSDFIDLVAPGVGILTTENNDTYNPDTGSSYAAPMVAGAAALIRSVFPEWNALQVMEQLRVSSDDIYDVGSNGDFIYKFGKGRLNVFKALADFDQPSIRISDLNYTNGLEEAAYFGDTLEITVEFTNYLQPTENVGVELTSSSPFVSIIQQDFSINSLGTFETISNENSTFKVVLSNDLPENQSINFRLLLEGEFYSDYQSFQIQSSPQIRLFQFNKWNFGFTSTGNLGRSKGSPFSNYAATFNGNQLIDHMGLVIYAGEDSLYRNTFVNSGSFQYVDDFQSTQALKRYDDITANLDIRSVFTERDDMSTQLDIFIEQRFLGWNDEENLLIHQLKLENRSENNYDSLYFAFLTDYALGDKGNNTLMYDSAFQLSYAYDASESEYVGLSLLTQQDSIFYAFDLDDLNSHTSDLENDSLKQRIIKSALKDPFSKQSAGQLSGGNNVAGLQGVMLPEFNSYSTSTVSFAVLRADNLDDLRNLVQVAKEKDSLSYTLPVFGKQIFICKDDTPVIAAPEKSQFKVYASATIDTALYSGPQFETSTISTDTVFYVMEIDSLGIEGNRKRFALTIQQPEALFSLPSEPILFEAEKVNSFRFTDDSEQAIAWQWTFSNGFVSTRQHPSIVFNEEGEYSAQLIITNSTGCKDTLSKSFEVFQRASKPRIGNMELCMNDDLVLIDPSVSNLVVYSDSLLTNEIFRGPEFVVEDLKRDTTFFIRNEDGEHPSESIKIKARVIPLKAKMQLSLDMSASTSDIQGIANSNSEFAQNIIWMIGKDTLGTDQEIYFELARLKNNALKLIAISESNCIDSTFLSTTASVVPEFEPYYLCESETVVLSALNSNAVYYFEDEALTQFIGKGQDVRLEGVTENMSVYAVNVEDFQPSEVVEVPVFVSDLSPDFSVSHDTINLAFDEEVKLEAQSGAAINWLWQFDGEIVGNDAILNYPIKETGVYEVQLTVGDTLGCLETLAKKLVVFNDPLLGNKNELRSYFSIFPNPASKFIHLTGKNQFQFDTYSIIDTKGQEIVTVNNNKPILQTEIIDVSELKQGAYYLIIRKDKKEASFLFVISR